jgi:Mce-associated membrane protein
MTEAKEPPEDSATSKTDAMALLEEAEAEAAEAEALAAAARARARVARLRRQAQAAAETVQTAEAETVEAEVAEAAEAGTADKDSRDAEEGADGTVEESPDAHEGADVTVEDSDAETDEQAAEETVEAAEPESRLAKRRRRVPLPSLSAISKVAAIIFICAFVVASGYIVWQDRKATERAQRTASFVAGARQGVVNMTSLDFNKAKEDIQRVLDSSTGEFRDDFQQRAKDFTSVVEQSKVVSQGTVTAAALESMNAHTALVLVAATSRITNSAGAQNDPREWRLRVTVTEDGGQYKMSKVEFVP